MSVYILGINSAYHESAAALLCDGILIAAAEEERFNRQKHAKHAKVHNPNVLPLESIKYCLKEAGICFSDVDHIGYSFKPEKRYDYNLSLSEKVDANSWGTPEGEKLFYERLRQVPLDLGECFGDNIADKFHYIDHHLCHAASSFFVSPFNEAAILSIDGIGETSTTWYGHGSNNKLTRIKEFYYPHSLGLTWTKFSEYLGFGEYGAWKVMGMCAYGRPDKYSDKIKSIIKYADGELTVNPDAMQYRLSRFDGLENIFGPRRKNREKIEPRHMDIAASLQAVTNEIVFDMARDLKLATKSDNLCMAGGVALNCIANAKIFESKLFKSIFIQPAPHDAGTALGAAFYIWNHMLGNERKFTMEHSFWGPSYNKEFIKDILVRRGLDFIERSDICEHTAGLIADGNIVAWFQDRMEFGPRALGNRSILADPRRHELVEIINEKIKHREYFRPFAPSVLEEMANDWFEIPGDSLANEFMLFRYKIKDDKLGEVPAITHADGSSRPQLVNRSRNPLYHKIISEFYKLTNVPMLLNTSFNDREPIICTPEDAINTCIKSKLNYLVIANYIINLSKET